MFQNEEESKLNNRNENYDSITQKDNLSIEKNNNSSDIKLSNTNETNEEETFMNKMLNNVFIIKILEYKNKFSNYLYEYLKNIHIASSQRNYFIFLTIGLIFIFISVLELPTFILTPAQFLFFFSLGNISIFISLFFYYGSQQFFTFLFEETRKILMLCYIFSVFFGMIIAWRKHYLISLMLAIVQIIFTTLFVVTMIPGCQIGIDISNNLIVIPIIRLKEFLKSFFIKNDNQNESSNLK